MQKIYVPFVSFLAVVSTTFGPYSESLHRWRICLFSLSPPLNCRYVEGLGRAMVCGGQSCDEEGRCDQTADCRYWAPESGGGWVDAPALGNPRFNFIMPAVENPDMPGAMFKKNVKAKKQFLL